MKLSDLNGSQELKSLISELKNLLTIPTAICESNVEDKFFKDQKLINWLSNHGVIVNGVPESRRGSQAVVYFFDDKVLKISDNKTEAEIASILKGDDVTAVVDVIDLGDGNYGILQDEVFIDSRRTHGVTRALDCIMAYFDDHGKESLFDKDLQNKVIKKFGRECEINNVKTGIEMLRHVYEKTGFVHDDAAPSNIGIRDGAAVFTDLGPNVLVH